MAQDFRNMSDSELFYALNSDKYSARTAFDELYSRYASKVYAYCRKVLKNEDTAKDIFQEVFIRVLESAKDDRVMTNTSGFIFRIARNLCFNEKQKKYNEAVSLQDFQMPVIDSRYESKEIREVMDLALEMLPEKYKEVIILKEFIGFSYKEIAEILEISMPVVKTRIYRAKGHLKEILTPYFDDLKEH